MAGGILFAGATLQQVGLQWTTAGKGGFITGLFVVIVPILGLFFGQRPGAGTWVGALLAAWGLYLLSVTEALDISRGDLLVFAGAFFWAGHVMLIGWLSPRMNPVRLASAQFAVCSALSLVTGLAIESVTLADLLQAALPILYGGFMSVGVAYTLQVVAQRNAPAAHAAIILCLEGAFAALAGWLVLDEAMGLRGFVGCVLMLGGMSASQPGLWGSRKTA